MARGPEKYVYFLRRADGIGPIKIGCAFDPVGRRNYCTAHSPYPIALLAFRVGNWRLEQGLHARFVEHRSHGEWFHPTPELIATIAQFKDGTFDYGALPAPVRLKPDRPRVFASTPEEFARQRQTVAERAECAVLSGAY